MYKENFGRINLWAWTEYSRIVYIDADCVVLRDISALFLLPHGVTAAVGAPQCCILTLLIQQLPAIVSLRHGRSEC